MQWLLIGGPAHGRVLNIKAGSQVRYPHSDGEDYLYAAQTFLHGGRAYRLGVCYSEGGAAITEIERVRLIESTRLEPLPDGVRVDAPTRWCPECRSAGVVGIEQDVCPTCDGTGKVAAAGVQGKENGRG